MNNRFFLLVAIISSFIINGCTSVDTTYQPPIIPVKISVNSFGNIDVLVSGKVATPFGSFSLTGSTTVDTIFDQTNERTLIVRIDDDTSVYRLVEDERFEVEFLGRENLYEKVSLQYKNDGDILLELRSTGFNSSPSILNERVLSGSPKDWLPTSEDFPLNWQTGEPQELTNDLVLLSFGDSSDKAAGWFREWRRITSYYIASSNKDSCKLNSGLYEIYAGTIVFRDADGAKQNLDLFRADPRDEGKDIKIRPISNVGIEAFYVEKTSHSLCLPPQDIFEVELSFQGYNAIGYVIVKGIDNHLDKLEVVEIAMRYAKLIEANFIEHSQ